jgi:hypothetical protein
MNTTISFPLHELQMIITALKAQPSDPARQKLIERLRGARMSQAKIDEDE